MEIRKIDFTAIPKTAIKVVTSPVEFFREMPKTGGFVEPLVFMVFLGIVSGLISGVFQAVSSLLGFHLYISMQMGVAAIIVMPFMVAIGMAIFGFVFAAILFVIWKLMGSGESYETAYRCVAYLAALSPITTLLGIIPYLGGAIGLVIVTIYLVTASVQTHGLAAKRAWVVFGIITALSIVFIVSAQIVTRRFVKNKEQAPESWKRALEEMQKADEEMQKKMEGELKKHQQSLSQPADKSQEPAQDMQKSAQEMQNAAKELQKQMEGQLKKQKQ